MAKENNKFMVARIRAEILEGLFNKLDEDLRDTARHYAKTGETRQKERWNRDTDEYEKVFDENGEPVMEDVYDYIPYTDEEFERNPELKLRADVIQQVMKEIEKLL